jgi:hypothetical protein
MGKNPVGEPLPGPYIAPGITDPRVAAYKRDLDERQKGRPAGGVPIPLLSGEARPGMTMADQATAARPPPQGGIFGGGDLSRPPPNLLPQDLLPEEATRDPAYREGGGSRYASSQPELAYKYGVIRNGQRVAPQQLLTGKPGLRPETIEGIQALGNFNRGADAKVEQEAAAGAGGAAARLADPGANPSAAPVSETDRAEVEKALKQLDDFDFNKFREAMMKDIINNDDQRKLIRERVAPLELDDLIVNGFVTQVVPVVPGKFEPEFQSLSGETELALKRLIMEESRSIEVNARYFLDKFSLMSVAAGVRAINRNPLPDYRDKEGNFSDEAFWGKFNRMMKLNFHMLASLGVNYFWFDIDVRKLFVAERVKNG